MKLFDVIFRKIRARRDAKERGRLNRMKVKQIIGRRRQSIRIHTRKIEIYLGRKFSKEERYYVELVLGSVLMEGKRLGIKRAMDLLRKE